MKPQESWLKSDTPEKWAEAMMRCQHGAKYCGQDGYCHREGECFAGNPPLVGVSPSSMADLTKRMAEVLKRNEWACEWCSGFYCPECGGSEEDGHKDACELDEVLRVYEEMVQ